MDHVVAHRDAERDGEYGEGSVAYSVTKPFDPAALEAELVAAHGEGPCALVIEGDHTKASHDSPVVMWLMRDDVKANIVHKVVADHKVKEPA